VPLMNEAPPRRSQRDRQRPAAAAQRWIAEQRVSAFFAAAGFVPIACLSAALIGFLPLFWTVRLLVMPMAVVAFIVGLRWPATGRLALTGLLAGMIATAVYDTARAGLVLTGVWHDFIPTIGRLALDDPHASPLWGYGYRFLFDGGAMAMTFAVLPGTKSWRSGAAFGVAICLGLFGTLLISPHAQQLTFRLTPLTAVAALTGHLIYGTVLGGLLQRWLQKPQTSTTKSVDADPRFSRALSDRAVPEVMGYVLFAPPVTSCSAPYGG
jgi:Family of unknown function (DUF6789)